MKKGKGLSIALIATMVMSMIFGVFTAPNVFAGDYPNSICCNEHEGSPGHIIITKVYEGENLIDYVQYLNDAGTGANRYHTGFEATSRLFSMKLLDAGDVVAGDCYAWGDDGESLIKCTSWFEASSCSHESTTYHAAVAGADCQTNGNVEYWTCAGCNQNFSDEACTTPIADINTGETGNHNMGTEFDETDHWYGCTVAGCSDIDEGKEKHQYGTDSSKTSYFTCECGFEYFNKYTTYANNIVSTACTELKEEIESCKLPDASFYKRDVDVAYNTFAESLAKAQTMEDGKTAVDNALASLDSIRTNVLAGYKRRSTVKLDDLYKENEEAIKNADIHELAKEAALADLAKIYDTCKAAIANGETKEAVDNGCNNAVASRAALAQDIENFGSHDILEGAESGMVLNSDKTIKIRVDADMNKFLGVLVNGILVDEANYELASGSTIINFKNDFLNSLGAGRHLVEMVWTNGTATTTMLIAPPLAAPFARDAEIVKDAAIDTTVRVGAPQGEVIQGEAPKTGDTTNMTLWAILTAVAVLTGVGATLLTEKERKEIKKSNLKIK